MSDRDNPDTKSMSVNVRISGALREHVERTTTEGDYESVSEYVRDLIRKDKAKQDEAAYQKVKSRLKSAFAEATSAFEPVSANDIRKAARKKRKRK
jgi:antitoxin ParD1/3/4